MKVKILFVFIFMSGCIQSHFLTKADPLSINQRLIKDGKLRFITKNKNEYELKITYMDSVEISGQGRNRNFGSNEWRLFNGGIKLDSIELLAIKGDDRAKTMMLIAGGATLAALYSYAKNGDNHPILTGDIDYQYTAPGSDNGGTSCPFIYSWNGKDFEVEGEAIGVAFGKSLEMSTSTLLHSLSESTGHGKVKITNERLETHYINAVQIRTFEIDQGAIPYLDEKNRIWPVYDYVSARSAIDNSGESILSQVSKMDKNYWQSNLISASQKSGFNDVIELDFSKPQNVNESSLILHAINTKFSETVFQNIFDFLGDESLAFVHSVENDSEMVATLKKWLNDVSLKVDVWNSEKWTRAGILQPEANVAPFSRLIRINLKELTRDKVKIRLSSLSDVWKFDAIFMDYSQVQQLPGKQVKLDHACNSKQEDIKTKIENANRNYEVLFPGDKINLSFAVKKKSGANMKNGYLINVRGYLHEWKPAQKTVSVLSALGRKFSGSKIEYLKQILNQPKIFLPLIYAVWENDRNLKRDY